MWEKEAGPSPTAAPCPWGQPCHPVTPAGPCSLLPPGPSLPQRCRPGRVLEHCLQGCGKRLLGTSHPPLLPPSPPASPQAAPPSFLGTAMHIRGFGLWPWVPVGGDCPPTLYCTLWQCGRAGGLTWGTARADKTRLHEAHKRWESQRSNSAPLGLS